TAARLWQRVLAGGGAAAGFARWGLAPGARADLLVLDLNDAALRGMPADHLLDAVVFAAPARPFRDVMVAGQWRLQAGVAPTSSAIAARFDAAMQALWSGGA
ncbi:MAG: formimidoylglutamate deiminase, partial [Rubrivivax sp.]|nr:formimidoylglutamate deiminase [Rubrivivax sp.]